MRYLFALEKEHGSVLGGALAEGVLGHTDTDAAVRFDAEMGLFRREYDAPNPSALHHRLRPYLDWALSTTPPQKDSAFVRQCAAASSVAFTDGIGVLPRALLAKMLAQPAGSEGAADSAAVDWATAVPAVDASLPASHVARSHAQLKALAARETGGAVAQAERAAGVLVVPRCRVAAIRSNGAGSVVTVSVSLEDGNKTEEVVFDADFVISTLPANALARVASWTAPADVGSAQWRKRMADVLSQIPFANVGVVSMGFKEKKGLFPEGGGFGYLVPTKERSASTATAPEKAVSVLGMTWDSDVFPGQSLAWIGAAKDRRTMPQSADAASLAVTPSEVEQALQTSSHPSAREARLTVMMGGAATPDVADAAKTSDADRRAIANDALRLHLGVSPDVLSRPAAAVRSSVAVNAIPQYTVGHEARVREAVALADRIWNGRVALLGNSFFGIGLSDTISTARGMGRALAAKVKAETS
jgi:hypothetical protein